LNCREEREEERVSLEIRKRRVGTGKSGFRDRDFRIRIE
jgi:hypothetical protein